MIKLTLHRRKLPEQNDHFILHEMAKVTKELATNKKMRANDGFNSQEKMWKSPLCIQRELKFLGQFFGIYCFKLISNSNDVLSYKFSKLYTAVSIVVAAFIMIVQYFAIAKLTKIKFPSNLIGNIIKLIEILCNINTAILILICVCSTRNCMKEKIGFHTIHDEGKCNRFFANYFAKYYKIRKQAKVYFGITVGVIIYCAVQSIIFLYPNFDLHDVSTSFTIICFIVREFSLCIQVKNNMVVFSQYICTTHKFSYTPT